MLVRLPIIDTDPNPIFVKDQHGVFQLVNTAMAAVYGTTVEAMIAATTDPQRPNEGKRP